MGALRIKGLCDGDVDLIVNDGYTKANEFIWVRYKKDVGETTAYANLWLGVRVLVFSQPFDPIETQFTGQPYPMVIPPQTLTAMTTALKKISQQPTKRIGQRLSARLNANVESFSPLGKHLNQLRCSPSYPVHSRTTQYPSHVAPTELAISVSDNEEVVRNFHQGSLYSAYCHQKATCRG